MRLWLALCAISAAIALEVADLMGPEVKDLGDAIAPMDKASPVMLKAREGEVQSSDAANSTDFPDSAFSACYAMSDEQIMARCESFNDGGGPGLQSIPAYTPHCNNPRRRWGAQMCWSTP